jgi:hypothetical protein
MGTLLRVLLVAVLASIGLLAATSTASADAPVVTSFHTHFVDVNPCAPGTTHTVTIDATVSTVSSAGATVVHFDRHVSTSSGFAGNGEATFVFNAQNTVFTLHDVLFGPDGSKLLAGGTLIFDATTGEPKLLNAGLRCVQQ